MGKPVIIFVNHQEKQCGVYQYGKHTYEILKKSDKYEFIYCEAASPYDVKWPENEHNPDHHTIDHVIGFAPEVPVGIIYNYHPLTMPWLGREMQERLHHLPKTAKHYVIHHEGSFPANIRCDKLILPDCTIADTDTIVGVPRPLFIHEQKYYPKDIPIITSFGFGFGNKGFGRVVKQVNDEFNEAIIRLHIPRAFYGDRKGEATAQVIPGCQAEMKKPKIQLHISHEFLDDNSLLEFLSQSACNLFLYDEMPGRGLSSVIDYALSVRIPLAINRTTMFRHIYNTTPSICIEDNSLKQIIANGPEATDIYRDKWSHAEFIKKYESILSEPKNEL